MTSIGISISGFSPYAFNVIEPDACVPFTIQAFIQASTWVSVAVPGINTSILLVVVAPVTFTVMVNGPDPDQFAAPKVTDCLDDLPE